jgi:hypothetical protein
MIPFVTLGTPQRISTDLGDRVLRVGLPRPEGTATKEEKLLDIGMVVDKELGDEFLQEWKHLVRVMRISQCLNALYNQWRTFSGCILSCA